MSQDEGTTALDMYDDGLDDDTRRAFAASFHLAELDVSSPIQFEAIHQELRLAIQVWRDAATVGAQAQSQQATELEHLIGRDHLAIVRGAGGDLRVVRAG